MNRRQRSSLRWSTSVMTAGSSAGVAGPGPGRAVRSTGARRRRRHAVRRRQPWAAGTRDLVGARGGISVRGRTRRDGLGRRRVRCRARLRWLGGGRLDRRDRAHWGNRRDHRRLARRLRCLLARRSGDVSILTDSWMSVEALRNSRIVLPSDAPTSGSLPGPRMSRAITRMMISSGAPIGMLSSFSCGRERRDRAAHARNGRLPCGG